VSFTLADVKSSLQARGYGTDTAAQQLEFTKTVLRRIYGERRWRFLFKTNSTVTIAAGASTASLATITDRQTGKLEAVRLVPATGDTLDLEELPLEELRHLDAVDNSNGYPLYYARQDNTTLQFWPRADQTYTVAVDYVSLPTLPAADGDAITFPDEHQDVIVDGIAVLIASRQRDWNARNAWQQDYMDGYAKLARAQGMGSTDSPARMGHWGGWDKVSR
jgi:hypothetical protein